MRPLLIFGLLLLFLSPCAAAAAEGSLAGGADPIGPDYGDCDNGYVFFFTCRVIVTREWIADQLPRTVTFLG